MKYRSEILKEIIDKEGHITSLLHYESECIEHFIDENKEGYPKLTDYQSEWLNYINEKPEKPVGKFPYKTVIANPNATIDNVVPYEYKSAILKGSTKYRDIDTGEFLETFEEGRNLELVSVKMPVLTTTGKNLFNPKLFESKRYTNGNNTPNTDDTYCCYDIPIEAKYGDVFRWSTDVISYKVFIEFDENGNQVDYSSESAKVRTYTVKNSSTKYIKVQTNNTVSSYLSQNPMLEKEPLITTIFYEPYKSKILTVNEDVTLRGIGDVQDELDLLTGEVTTKYGKMVIDGREEFIWGHSWYVGGTVYHLDNPTILDNYNFKKGGNLICGQIQILDDFNYDDKIGIHPNVDRGIVLVVPNELTGGKNNVAGLRAWLNENPITIVYELNQQSIKTVDLTIEDQNGNALGKIKPIEGTMHISTDGNPIKPTFTGEVPVEAITQNLASFIEE